ncbi:MFS transporter [Pseudomonas cavernae]|uniref:MFS transporter n=1 Tax=Pseudomonas cavernae TaxID=2320867 RepID=A0A385Z4K3_9PSED|nr:MFS transporter [Pseudomonas cavernae]AYC33017.1 MFS transporter [Pseudomonas cavernae]
METAALVIGSFAVVMSATTINVAIAPMMRDLAISHHLAQQFSSVFLGMTVVCAPLAAWIADRFGAWWVFRALLLLYVLVSLLAGVSDSFSAMLIARGLQGLCAGIIQPLSLFLILESALPEKQGRTMSMFGLGVVMAPALGPTLAGFVVELFGWRYTFWLGVPPALIALGLVAWARPVDLHQRVGQGRLDLPGLVLLACLVAVVFAWPPLLAYSTWLAAVLVVAWLLLLVVFWHQQERSEEPLIAPKLFRYPRFLSGILVTVAYGAGMYGSIFLVPLLLQDGLGESAVTTGNLMLLGGLALALSIQMAGQLVDRFSPRLVVMIGLACFAFSCLLLALPASLGLIALGIVLGRIGLGMIIPSLYTAMVRAVPDELLRRGTVVTTLLRQAGGALGITMIGVLLASLSAANLKGWSALPAGSAPYSVIFAMLGLLFLWALRTSRRLN